ncbi:MAG: hypothetical protein ACI39R_00705 [Lachnospiraceae bacterium]
MNERQIKLMRIVSPYINAHIRPHLLTFLSVMELQINASSITTPLNYSFLHNEPLVTNRDKLINELKCNANQEELKIIDKILMFEQMMNLMEMMQEMQKAQNPDKNGGTDNSATFQMLKGLLPKESMETFEFVKMMMEKEE